jgi:hypothetical protein
MLPPAERTAAAAAVDEAVLMNSLLDIEGILATSRNLGSILDNYRAESLRVKRYP